MIAFTLAFTCYFIVIQSARLYGEFQYVSKRLLILIALLLYGCLLNFVDAPPDEIAAGGLFSWAIIFATEFAICVGKK